MAAFVRHPKRAVLARRQQLDMGHDAAPDSEPTPTPRPVAVDIPGAPYGVAPASKPAPVRRSRLLARSVEAFLALALVGTAALAVAGRARPAAEAEAQRPRAWSSFAAAAYAAVPEVETPRVEPPAVVAAPVAPAVGAHPEAPRADAHVARTGYAHVPGGVVFVPGSFSSDDGGYDLYLHFHGNTRVVNESAEVAGLNAIVAVVNLGVNSAPYLDAYEEPGSYERLLASIDHAVAERGLEHPHLGRVAIGSWSGGYGAVSRILEVGRGQGSLDAVLVLDGIHCGYLEENPKALNAMIISPFLGAARRAAEGKLLFSITHSEIDPVAYAGTHVTADYLLDAVHGRRGEPQAAPDHLQLRAAEGAVSKKLEKWMEPTSDTTVGSFHVRGYRGNTPEHHMAHLLQMGATVMPELVHRWRATPR
jgi:hypothetical protein